MKPVIISFILCLFYSAGLKAQHIDTGEMDFSYTIERDSILIEIKAPTKGWLAIGFNDENEIVGSDLKMIRIRNNRLEAEDQFVRGFQDHPADSYLGGFENIRLIGGTENAKGTALTLKIPFQSNDRFDFQHELGKSFWLILAYSVEDDFDHHSIMRKHFQIKWKKG